MFSLLFRILGGLVAATVAVFGISLVAAISYQGAAPPEHAGWLTLVLFVAAAVAFVWMFRRLGSGKWEQRRVESRIRKLKRQAERRNLAPHAWQVASVLGGGTAYTASSLRVAGDATVTVERAEGGTWHTVLTARWHPEVRGQQVASAVEEDPVWNKRHRQLVLTKTVGQEPARWEVLAYIPGDWEDELNRLWEAAKQAALEGAKGRFGL